MTVLTKINIGNAATSLGAAAATTSVTGWITEWQPFITAIVSVITVIGFLCFGFWNSYSKHKQLQELRRHNKTIEEQAKEGVDILV